VGPSDGSWRESAYKVTPRRGGVGSNLLSEIRCGPGGSYRGVISCCETSQRDIEGTEGWSWLQGATSDHRV